MKQPSVECKHRHFDEMFVTGCTGSWHPVQPVEKISSKGRHLGSVYTFRVVSDEQIVRMIFTFQWYTYTYILSLVRWDCFTLCVMMCELFLYEPISFHDVYVINDWKCDSSCLCSYAQKLIIVSLVVICRTTDFFVRHTLGLMQELMQHYILTPRFLLTQINQYYGMDR